MDGFSKEYLFFYLKIYKKNTGILIVICELTLHIFFTVAPVTVNIVNKVDRLVVGRESEVVCRSTGSRPPAHITWYLGGQRLEGGGTESVSIFRLIIVFIDIPLKCIKLA